MTTNHQQKTTNYQQTNTNYNQTTTNGHPWGSNQKSDVSFFPLAPGNYKKHPDFEKHSLQSQISGGGGGLGGGGVWAGPDKVFKYYKWGGLN